jgi:alanine racemase
MNNQKLELVNHVTPTAQIATDKPFFNWIELSKSAVDHNANQFIQWLGPKTKISGVIKSNAYGHGILEIAQIYQSCGQIESLCVINLSEALIVAQHGITKPILILGYLDAPYETIVHHNFHVVIYDLKTASKLNDLGQSHQQKIKIHIKFDTGMHRLGVMAHELESFLAQINLFPWLTIEGIFSHLAESYQQKRTFDQESIFLSKIVKKYTKHLSNSHGVFTTTHQAHSFARIGVGLYGYLQKESAEKQALLQPVLSLKSKILQIKSIKAGSKVGYDGMFVAPHDMVIATIAIGYYEGLDARLSNLGSVIVQGQFAQIIGRVCMNLTIIDVSTIKNCAVNDVVTLLGKDCNAHISAYDWSKLTNASVYNLLAKLAYTIPKLII